MFCKTCNKEKDSTCFYRCDPHHCKECKREYVRIYRMKNLDKIRAYDRNRPNKAERTQKCKEYKDRLRIENPEKFDNIFHSARKQYRKNHKEKCKAEGILNDAIRFGKIKRPDICSVCGIKCKPQGHHYDYKKPLDVIWVCVKCHADIHKKMRDEKRSA